VDNAKVSALAQHSGTQRAERLTVMGFDFKVENLAETINFLEKFNEDVLKVLKKELKSGANEVAKASRSLIPNDGLSNWGQWTEDGTRGGRNTGGRDLGFIGAFVKRGIVVQQQKTRSSGMTVGFGYRVVSKSAAGAIYELAGSVTKNEGMGLAMNKKRPTNNYPRTLFPAYYAAMPKAMQKIEAALDKATRSFGA
jgi:hypothetical protein